MGEKITKSFFRPGRSFVESNETWVVAKLGDYTDDSVTYRCVYYYSKKENPTEAPPIEECEFTPIDELIELVQAAQGEESSDEDDLPVSALRAYRREIRGLSSSLAPQKRDKLVGEIRKRYGMSTRKKKKKKSSF